MQGPQILFWLDAEQADELGCSFQIFPQAFAIGFGVDRLNYIDRDIAGFLEGSACGFGGIIEKILDGAVSFFFG